MFFKNHIIVYSYPPALDLFPGPAGMPVSPDMIGQEFHEQCLALWELNKGENYCLAVLRDGHEVILDPRKTLLENGLRNGDPIKILKTA